MEQIEQAAWAKDRYVLSETWLLQMYRRLRPHWLIVLGIALGCPVLVYCATKILWRAIWSLVTGAAFLEGRAYVIPQDVKMLAPDVLRHRLLLSYEAEAEGMTADDVIRKILNELKTP